MNCSVRFRRVVPLFVAVLVAACSDDPAAPPDGETPVTYANMIGSAGVDGAHDVVVNASGLRVVAGEFVDTLRVTGEPDSVVAVTTDVYLAAFRDNGALAWLAQLGGDGDDVANAIARDGNELFVTGSYVGASRIGATDLDPFGLKDLFISKLDATASPTWALGVGSAWDDFGTDMEAAGDGGVFVTGAVGATITVGTISIGYDAGRQVGFLLRVGASGDALWGETALTPDGVSICTALARGSSGNLFVVGHYENTDLWFGGTTIGNGGGNDAYLARYGALGTPLGITQIGGTGEAHAWGVAATADGPIVVGSFSGDIDFDVTGPLGAYTADGTDGFVAAFTNAGAFRWARIYSGAGDEGATRACTIGSKDVLVYGEFDGTLTLGTRTLTSHGGLDLFVVRLDKDGDPVWAESFGSASNDVCGGVASTGDYAIVSGIVDGDATFPNGVRAGFGNKDGFIYQR